MMNVTRDVQRESVRYEVVAVPGKVGSSRLAPLDTDALGEPIARKPSRHAEPAILPPAALLADGRFLRQALRRVDPRRVPVWFVETGVVGLSRTRLGQLNRPGSSHPKVFFVR